MFYTVLVDVTKYIYIGGSNPGRVKSKTEKLSTFASLVSVRHLKARAWPVSV